MSVISPQRCNVLLTYEYGARPGPALSRTPVSLGSKMRVPVALRNDSLRCSLHVL